MKKQIGAASAGFIAGVLFAWFGLGRIIIFTPGVAEDTDTTEDPCEKYAVPGHDCEFFPDPVEDKGL